MARSSTAESVTEGIDLSGKVILVTGVNSGLGEETMRVLCMRGAHVIGAARTLAKAKQACAQVSGTTTPIACELSDLASVASAADQISNKVEALDSIVCNAGIMALPELQQAHDLEMQFLCNHVGHFLLLKKLLPLLHAAPEGRVVLVSSDGHKFTVDGGIDFDNLDGSKGYDGWKFYGQSKLANILTAKALATQLADSNVTANAVHPGVIRTNLGRSTSGLMSSVIKFFAPLFDKTVGQGAATQVYLAAHPDAAQYNGLYFADVAEKSPSPFAKDEQLAQHLWNASENLVEPYL